jgi:peptide/nickel transport system substrate-binding protein
MDLNREGELERVTRPVVGMGRCPSTLNPFATASAYARTIIDVVYTPGVRFHPETNEIVAWGFTDWTVHPENAGSSDPTIVATLREDLTWSDTGEPVTAADVKFTIEYVTEHELRGLISELDFRSIGDVRTDGEQTVEFYLDTADCRWPSILGTPILPAHRWSGVSDPESYDPVAEGGPVGSGPFVIGDVQWDDYVLLECRDDEAIPWNDLARLDWLDEDGPFVDELLFVGLEGEGTREEAALAGDIDQTWGPIEVDAARTAEESTRVKLFESDDDGWGHISFNTCRVPLDDVAFRQFSVKLMDHEAVAEDFYDGYAIPGSYVTPVAYEEWRPPEPWEIDEFEGIEVPSLSFPGNGGPFELDEAAIELARTFLRDHPDAVHEYTFEEAVTELGSAPDGKELYVDGVPLPEAHTDGHGANGIGPLRLSMNPPGDDPSPRERAHKTWVQTLRRVGVPVEFSFESWQEQTQRVDIEQDFDMYERGWDRIDPNNDHFTTLFSSENANLSGEPDGQRYLNAMGYTGADDLIERQRQVMDNDRRKPIVKRLLVRIWYDSPTLVQEYIKNLFIVNSEYSGHVSTTGGINNVYTWLNVRKEGDGSTASAGD